jgi:hypothetical protein
VLLWWVSFEVCTLSWGQCINHLHAACTLIITLLTCTPVLEKVCVLIVLLLWCVAAELNTTFADDVLSRVPKGELLSCV